MKKTLNLGTVCSAEYVLTQYGKQYAANGTKSCLLLRSIGKKTLKTFVFSPLKNDLRIEKPSEAIFPDFKSVLRFRDVYPGSEFFHPGSASEYFNQKMVSKLSEI